MLYLPMPIPPSADYWNRVACALMEHDIVRHAGGGVGNLSGIRVVVPEPGHIHLFRAALAARTGHSFIAPRITTLSAWLAELPPEIHGLPLKVVDSAQPPGHIERISALYAEMRRHPWLKRLFQARRNADLLPVAQSLLALFDELSEAWLPSMQIDADASKARWRTALEQLPLPAHGILSEEARLVWTLWQGQFDRNDPAAVCLARMRRLAARTGASLVWIGDGWPRPLHDAFVEAWARHHPVLPVVTEWHPRSLAPVYAEAWPEVIDGREDQPGTAAAAADAAEAAEASFHADTGFRAAVHVHAARSLEDEARHAAQTVIEWLTKGKTRIAVIAQDPVAGRRLRALLERAGIAVSDECGRKLSDTRSAGMLAAWLNVVTTRAGSIALLDLLKCPGLCADLRDKDELVLRIEYALRRANVSGGWSEAIGAVAGESGARLLLMRIAEQAWLFAGRKSLDEWVRLTQCSLRTLGMDAAMEAEAMGSQVLALLSRLAQESEGSRTKFGFAEWRAMLGTQLESTLCIESDADTRVTMLPLSGARLRRFDAVIMVGADAAHLPLPPEDTLVFANAVRRELGLVTRDMQQRGQLRAFAELLNAHAEIVLCWQACRGGEANAPSPWIDRLGLAFQRAGSGGLPAHRVSLHERRLYASPPRKPSPAAPELLPAVLSASAYNSLVACPYQFFANRMLGLAPLEEFNELPEKRDYGGWLHAILKTYHETIRDNAVGIAAREDVLRSITEKIFRDALTPGSAMPSAAVLNFYSRWKKCIPAYLAWANEREAGGWRFVFGEQMLEKILEWQGGKVTLRGRVDRIDEHQDGARAVLDYKTRRLQTLRNKLKDGDDHQLAFHALLSDAPVTAGHLVALEQSRSSTGDAAAEDFIEWQGRLEAHIIRSMQAIADGASLPASGIERICVHCEVRGLCRKGAW